MDTEALREYILFVLETVDDVSSLGLHEGWVNRSALHEAAVKPYGLTEHDTWMLFANMEHDYRWCGRSVDRLVAAYDDVLQKLSREKKKNYEVIDGEICDTGYYDYKMRFCQKTLRELTEFFSREPQKKIRRERRQKGGRR